MQPLQADEIASLAHSLVSYENCRLQRIESGDDWLSFLFYGQGQEKPLFLSLNPKCPVLLPVQTPGSLKKKTIPALLFLRAHFDSHILRKVTHDPHEGRVLHLHFSQGGTLEIRLFPHGQNLVAIIDDKKISTHKVSELQSQAATNYQGAPPRALSEIVAQFQSQFADKAPASIENKKAQIEKMLSKKMRALELVEKDIEDKRLAPYREIGEWMKAHQSLDVAEQWKHAIDSKKTFADNLNLIFQKAKQIDEKLKSGEVRREQLLKEIEKLKAGDWQLSAAQPSALKKAGAKGRTIELNGGRLLFLGRSAEENIKLLRAAQPWDFWLHIKDFPGSHGIIRRNKQEKINDGIFIEALQHLISKQYGTKAKSHDGEKFACLVVECRFVKPIKGDRIGRVSYQNERVLTLQFKS